MARKKKQQNTRTISWGAWCEEIGGHLGVDVTDLLDHPVDDEDEEDEPEYEDEYEQYEPKPGKQQRGTWTETQPPPRKNDPGLRREQQRERDVGIRTERGEKEDGRDPETPSRPREEVVLLTEIPPAVVTLEKKVLAVRTAAPAALGGVEALTPGYREVAERATTVDTLELDGLRALNGRIADLTRQADRLLKLFAEHQDVDALITWTAHLRSPDFSAELPEQTLKDAQKQLSDATLEEPANAQAYAAAADTIAQFKAKWELFDAARQLFRDGRAKLETNLVATRKDGSKNEILAVNTLDGEITQACQPNTQAAYEQAAKLLPQLEKLLVTTIDAIGKRRTAQADCEVRLKAVRGEYTLARSTLGSEYKLLKDKVDITFKSTLETANVLIRGPVNEFDAARTKEAIDMLAVQVETLQDKIEDALVKVAERDRKTNALTDPTTYNMFAYNNPATWDVKATLFDGVPVESVNLSGADNSNLNRIARGDLADNATAQTGRPYHCHMCNGGGGGISFIYNHLGGNRVQPVIYDYAIKRQDNQYEWKKMKKTQSAASGKVPGYVKGRRKPGDED